MLRNNYSIMLGFLKLYKPRPRAFFFLLALLLLSLSACTAVHNVPLDYKPLVKPEKLNKAPVALRTAVRFRSDMERETMSFSIGDDRFVMKLGESLSAALKDAAAAAFKAPAAPAPSAPAPAEKSPVPYDAFLEFQLGAALVDSPKSFWGDILGLHDINYRVEVKAFLSDPAGKEIWRATLVAQEEKIRVYTISAGPEKAMGKHLSAALRKLADDFITQVVSDEKIAEYVVAAREERLKPKTTLTSAEIQLGFALRPALRPPKAIGVVDLRPVEQAGALLAYDLSKNLRRELSSWGLNIYDPENTRTTHPEAYTQYWACENLQCLTDAGRKMGYDYMIYGSVMKSQDKYLFTLRLLTVDPARDLQIKVVSAEGVYQLHELSPALKKLAESLLAAE